MYMLYDYAIDAVKRAFPTARIRGFEVAGGPAGSYLGNFLNHVLNENSYCTPRGRKEVLLTLFLSTPKEAPTSSIQRMERATYSTLKFVTKPLSSANVTQTGVQPASPPNLDTATACTIRPLQPRPSLEHWIFLSSTELTYKEP
jgi:hypothetical protein